MRIVSGTIKTTPLPWLPVLSNILPPDLRRKQALLKTIQQCEVSKNSLLSKFIANPAGQVLTRKPPYVLAQELIRDAFNATDAWRATWVSANLENSELVVDPSEQVPGFDLKRHTWTQLNRIRTGHGRCNQTLHQWGATDDPACDC